MRSGFSSTGPAFLLVLGLAAGAGATVLAQEQPQAPAPEGPRKTRLQGSAFLDRNRNVAGVTVVATPEDDPSRVYITATDRRGFFKIDDMVEGDYRVLMRREGFRPVTKRNVLLKYPFRAVVEVEVKRIDGAIPVILEEGTEEAGPPNNGETGSLHARVVDRDGQPVNEVDVRLSPVEGDSDPRFLRTDEEGTFGTDGLKPGRWHIDVHALGYLPMRAEFEVLGPVELTMVVVPQPGDYEPSPLDLLPPEEPIPPPELTRK